MTRHPSKTCGPRRTSASPAPAGPRRAKRSWTACLLLAGALAGAPAAPAMGWRAEVSASGALTIDGGAAANALRVRDGGALVLVTDEGDGFTGGTPAGCVLMPDEALACLPPAGGVLIRGGDASDEIDIALAAGGAATGDAGDDLLVGGAGVDVLDGGEGHDILEGRGAGDALTGDDGEDGLDGGPGADLLDGGAGADLLSGGDDGDALHGATGDDELVGGPGADHLVDGEGADLLDGGAGDDVADGGPGDDEVLGGAGVNALAGGPGNDVVALAGDAGDAAAGGAGDDELEASAAAGAVTVDGGDGRDLLEGGGAGDTLRGGADADELVGAAGDDVIAGGAGDDLIEPGHGLNTTSGDAGADEIALTGMSGEGADGGEGDDVLLGGAAGSVLRGGTGADRLEGQDAADGLDAGPGDDVLLGGGGADALQGADGDDQLAGGLGADDLRGGPGRDTLSYDEADDGVRVSLDDRPGDGAAGEGDDAHSDVETLVGSAGDDVLRAGAAGATLRGGEGDDRLDGGPGGDVLDGGLADDVLDGDAGADVLAGGDGSDTASYTARIAGVVVDLRDAGPVNGEPGEGDTLVMVENVAAGAGRDRVTGQAGVSNRIDAGDGDDRVLARDRDTVADDVVCGDGRDAAQLDRQDAWDDESCEAVTASGVVQAPQLTFRGGKSLRVRRSGLARLQLYCDGDTVRWCTGRVGLRTRAGRRAAHRTFRIGAGLHRHLHVRMTHRMRRRLARGEQPRLRAVIRVKDALGRRATVRFDVRAKAARR